MRVMFESQEDETSKIGCRFQNPSWDKREQESKLGRLQEQSSLVLELVGRIVEFWRMREVLERFDF